MKEISIPLKGYSVAADWLEGSSDEVLLVLIGHGSSKQRYAKMTKEIAEETKTSALTLDYSGHGNSPYELNEVTPAQNFMEVIAAFDWIRSNNPNKKINVMGVSYGGYFATLLSMHREFNKLILRVPAIYQPKDFYTQWGLVEDRHDYRYRTDFSNYKIHSLLATAGEFKGKTLVIHHEKDDICPLNTTRAFEEAFNASSWTVPGIGHNMNNISPETYVQYRSKIIEWLN